MIPSIIEMPNDKPHEKEKMVRVEMKEIIFIMNYAVCFLPLVRIFVDLVKEM